MARGVIKYIFQNRAKYYHIIIANEEFGDLILILTRTRYYTPNLYAIGVISSFYLGGLKDFSNSDII